MISVTILWKAEGEEDVPENNEEGLLLRKFIIKDRTEELTENKNFILFSLYWKIIYIYNLLKDRKYYIM